MVPSDYFASTQLELVLGLWLLLGCDNTSDKPYNIFPLQNCFTRLFSFEGIKNQTLKFSFDESFRAIKLSNTESFRGLKFSDLAV